ncbi:MAG: tryptophan-rich sensory protein [Chthonomonadales bacterium]|nr:tryptophan-rich sensory protein [Chthonomonadales bacterium]
MKSGLGLIAFLLIVLAAAAVGARYMPGEWYASLRKPPFNPPNWIFGPVWTALYLGMAVAAWLVWREGGLRVQALPLALFGAQLILNAAWSFLFFGLRRPDLALVNIVCLGALIAATAVAFRPVSTAAFVLMLPYLAWVSFATVLNASLWWLNRAA